MKTTPIGDDDRAAAMKSKKINSDSIVCIFVYLGIYLSARELGAHLSLSLSPSLAYRASSARIHIYERRRRRSNRANYARARAATVEICSPARLYK